jgi:hypothetical protein
MFSYTKMYFNQDATQYIVSRPTIIHKTDLINILFNPGVNFKFSGTG